MTQTEELLIALLARGLFGTQHTFDASKTDWAALWQEAEFHTVTPLIYDSLSADERAHIPPEISQRWQRSVMTTLWQNEQIAAEQRRILSLMAAETIPCVILKGSSSAMNYPKPELRCSGDIDLYFSPDEIDRAQALLTSHGYILSEGDDGTGSHRAMHRGPFIVELHHAPSGLPDSPVGDAIRAYFMGAERRPLTVGDLPVLPADSRAVLLLAHKLEHVMTSGLGLRQMCDWAVFIARELSPELWTELSPTLRRFGLLHFCRVVTRACVEYLGLPVDQVVWCLDAPSETCRTLIEDMLSSGNFGHKENRYGQRLFTNIESKGRISSLFRTGIAVCREHWPVCDRFPVLLPVAPAVLLARYYKQRKDGLRPALKPVSVYQGAAARQKLYKELRPFVAEDE